MEKNKLGKKREVKLRSLLPFKLKDRPNRNWKAFNLKAHFGFIPESIIISKPQGQNNVIILSAVLPKSENELR